MGRPKLGEGDTERLHVKISAEELTAIDDWRFANRIPSRSEAVRRLCQIGLLVENELEQIVDSTFEILHGLEDDWLEGSREWREMVGPDSGRDSFTSQEVSDTISKAVDRSMWATEALEGLYAAIVGLHNAVVPFVHEKTVREGGEKSKAAIETANRLIEEMERREQERELNRRLVIVWSAMAPEELEKYRKLTEEEKEVFLDERVARLKEAEEANSESEGP